MISHDDAKHWKLLFITVLFIFSNKILSELNSRAIRDDHAENDQRDRQNWFVFLLPVLLTRSLPGTF